MQATAAAAGAGRWHACLPSHARAPLSRRPAPYSALPACSGKKYGKLKAAAEVEASLEKYEPFIVK